MTSCSKTVLKMCCCCCLPLPSPLRWFLFVIILGLELFLGSINVCIFLLKDFGSNKQSGVNFSNMVLQRMLSGRSQRQSITQYSLLLSCVSDFHCCKKSTQISTFKRAQWIPNEYLHWQVPTAEDEHQKAFHLPWTFPDWHWGHNSLQR